MEKETKHDCWRGLYRDRLRSATGKRLQEHSSTERHRTGKPSNRYIVVNGDSFPPPQGHRDREEESYQEGANHQCGYRMAFAQPSHSKKDKKQQRACYRSVGGPVRSFLPEFSEERPLATDILAIVGAWSQTHARTHPITSNP
jgi:hypothetical protein